MQCLRKSVVATPARPAAFARPVLSTISRRPQLPARRQAPLVAASSLTPGGGGGAGDVPVSADTLGPNAPAVRNYAFGSFWIQLPLNVVSACILFFSIQFTKGPSDVSRWFTLVGIVCGFLSTFFAHGFLTLARQAIQQGKAVKRSYLVSNLLRNTNINLLGIGITLVGLQASVGTLVSKTMLSAANAPYAQPTPGATLISLDVFSLQASTNVLLAHFMSIVFTNLMLGTLNRLGASPSAA